MAEAGSLRVTVFGTESDLYIVEYFTKWDTVHSGEWYIVARGTKYLVFSQYVVHSHIIVTVKGVYGSRDQVVTVFLLCDVLMWLFRCSARDEVALVACVWFPSSVLTQPLQSQCFQLARLRRCKVTIKKLCNFSPSLCEAVSYSVSGGNRSSAGHGTKVFFFTDPSHSLLKA